MHSVRSLFVPFSVRAPPRRISDMNFPMPPVSDPIGSSSQFEEIVDSSSSSSFSSCFLTGFVDQSSLRAVHPRSTIVARKGMKNTYDPTDDWPPEPPLELANSSTRTTLLASTGDILSSLITSRAYTVELPDSI